MLISFERPINYQFLKEKIEIVLTQLLRILKAAFENFKKELCNKHLFGEHRELHAIWSILINDKKGYRNYPETKRWVGKNKALFSRHEQLVKEIKRRGYNYDSSLNKSHARGKIKQDEFVNTKAEQKIILKHKDCDCPL